MSNFKRLWINPKFLDSREFWLEQFAGPMNQRQIRELIKTKLDINLQWDPQLTKFRKWVQRQNELDDEADAMSQDEEQLKKQFGDDWTLDQIREEVLRRSYARSISTGDFASGRKTIAQDLNVEKVKLDRRKVELLEKKMAAFNRAQAAVKGATESKGGLTPETIRKIEKEFNLK